MWQNIASRATFALPPRWLWIRNSLVGKNNVTTKPKKLFCVALATGWLQNRELSFLPPRLCQARAHRARLGVTLGEGASRCLQPGCVEFAPLLFSGLSGANNKNMKNKLGMAGVVVALVFLSLNAKAQAPSSIAGDGFLAGVSSGAFPLASYGYFLFIPANSGSSYQVIGIYNVNNSSGTYTYTNTSASTARINANDSVGGALVLNASFSSASSGSYSETAPTARPAPSRPSRG